MLKGKLTVFGFLTLLVGLAYGNSLSNGFAFDDLPLIVENNLLTSIEFLPRLLTSDYWITRHDPYGVVPFASGLYRPLVSLSYAVNYALGGLAPWGYHLVNVLLHLLVTWLLYLLACHLMFPPAAAIVGAVLFAVHPLHTEAVANVVGRAELFMALGVLGSWWLALEGRRWASLAAFGGALCAKEQAMMLPVLLLWSDFCAGQVRAGLGQVLRRYGGYLAVLVAYLTLRIHVFGGVVLPPTPSVENPLISAEWGERMLTALVVAGRYLWLCLWPAALSADYSYNAIPLATSVLDPGVLLGGLAWAGLLGLAGWSWRRGSRRVALCVGLTGITFLPASNLLVPIGTIMGERLFYLPSAGLCLLAGLAYEMLRARSRLRFRLREKALLSLPLNLSLNLSLILQSLAALVCFAMIARTAVRNPDWMSTEEVFRSAVRTVPQSAKAHAALGNVLKRNYGRAEAEQILEHYHAAMAIHPRYLREDGEFAANYGDLLHLLGRTTEAIELLELAVAIDPSQGFILGKAYAKLGQPDKAERAWREALAFAPKDPLLRTKLSRILLEQGRYEEGLREAESVLQDYPDFILAFYNRALALEALGRMEEAAAAFERVLTLPWAPEEAKQDAKRKLQDLRAKRGKECLPGLVGC